MTTGDRLALLQAEHAVLLQAVRASVAAATRGEADPLIHIRHELSKRGLIPADGATPTALLAETGEGR